MLSVTPTSGRGKDLAAIVRDGGRRESFGLGAGVQDSRWAPIAIRVHRRARGNTTLSRAMESGWRAFGLSREPQARPSAGPRQQIRQGVELERRVGFGVQGEPPVRTARAGLLHLALHLEADHQIVPWAFDVRTRATRPEALGPLILHRGFVSAP